jgi:hypothetical protein
MSDALGGSDIGAIDRERHGVFALGAAAWLGLAAAPSFAIMALMTGVVGGGRMSTICGAAQEPVSLSGMVPMYLLMSVFHMAPWLKLIARRRSPAR